MLSTGVVLNSVGFSSNSEGEAHTKVIWDLFIGSSGATQPVLGECLVHLSDQS